MRVIITRRGVFWSQNLDVLLTSPSPDFPLSDQMKHFCSLRWDSSHLSRRRIAGQHKIPSLIVKACLFHPTFAWSLNPPFPGSLGIDWLWAANQLCFILAGLLGKLMNPDLTLYHEALISIHLWKFNMCVGSEKTREGRRDSLALQLQTRNEPNAGPHTSASSGHLGLKSCMYFGSSFPKWPLNLGNKWNKIKIYLSSLL